MPLEIERKFLVGGEDWRAAAVSRVRYRQGYLAGSARCSVRVRIGGGRAWVGIKARVLGAARHEFEYEIPVAEAEQMLDSLCAEGSVEKVRHRVPFGGHEWEVDEFLSDNAGLVVAEIELEREDERFARPPWIDSEVTNDERYYNSSLALKPWRSWPEVERRLSR